MSSNPRSLPYRIFVGVVIALGVAVFLASLMHWEQKDPVRGYFLILLALLASGLRVRLPQLVGTLSVNFVFVLLGVLELSLGETVLMGCLATTVQVWVHRHAVRLPAPALFHIANTAIATNVGYQAYHRSLASPGADASLVALAIVASVLFAMNTLPAAMVLTLAHRRRLSTVWKECNFRAFPYYIAGSFCAALFHYSGQVLGGQSPLLFCVVGFLIYASYHSYVGRMAAQNYHVEAMAALHLRTIEALALAIEAKDHISHTHLRRLQLYCVEIGREMQLDFEDLEAVRAAAVLHDVGKLAVPEHILSKPTKLTKEEFDKVKIHPVVGAKIIDRVHFPYPVAKVVKHHHEKWNGTGYPDNLKGDQIPIGARILAAVDTLDAMISDRPYRRALRFDEAIAQLTKESGHSFDPRVVDVIRRRHREFEARLESQAIEADRVLIETARGTQDRVERAPAAELPEGPDFVDSIAAARQEAQVLLELTQELGKSLHLDETLAVLATGLRRIVPFDSLVIYVKQDTALSARYASGDYTSTFLSREVPIGEGLVGWTARHDKPTLNGRPSVEMGLSEESASPIDSALTVPLPGYEGLAGVLMIGRRGLNAYSKDHLRILLAVSGKLGIVVENAIKYEQAAVSASTDFLTGLPNSRALHQQLESELARGRRLGGSLTVLVTDLNGFKDVNDRYGHLEGNAVLRSVAKALRQSCREYDYVARMGGDEFVLLLPGLAVEDLNLKIVQLNQSVAEAGRRVVGESNVSLSVGYSRFPEDGDNPEHLLDEADQRMYRAKTFLKLRSSQAGPRGFDFDWFETTHQTQ